MELQFTAKDDFFDALQEVNDLLTLAEQEASVIRKLTFVKSSLLFLTTQLEVLFENLVEEYVFLMKQHIKKPEKVPEPIILSAINIHLSEELLLKVKNKNSKCIEPLKKISSILSRESLDYIAVDNRFSYGKHGSKELESLLNRIGVSGIFDKCKVTETRESLLTDEDEVIEINVKSRFDALTGIRNAIIHENKNPNVTTESLRKDVEYMCTFIDKVVDYLTIEIQNACHE